MEYIRQWKVGNQTFPSKVEAQRYEAELKLDEFDTVEALIANADAVIALLRPFATPKRRAVKGNGAPKRSTKSTSAAATA